MRYYSGVNKMFDELANILRNRRIIQRITIRWIQLPDIVVAKTVHTRNS